MKYIIQYTLPYEHRVMVGIQAESDGAAITQAEKLINAGDIWNGIPEAPLLFDDYEEIDDGSPLEFTVEQALADDAPWPEPDASVKSMRKQEAAFEAARLLVAAYRRAEVSGSVDWSDVDQAYQAAICAVHEMPVSAPLFETDALTTVSDIEWCNAQCSP